MMTAKSRNARLQRCARYLVATACLALSACAAPDIPPDASIGHQMLSSRQILSGARVMPVPGIPFGASSQAGAVFQPFIAPAAAAAHNPIIYVYDAGYRQFFRYDASRQAMSRFTDYGGGNIAGMAVGSDLSLYVVDSVAQQVLHFSWDGKPLPGFSHDRELGRPVAVVADDATGQVFVADSLYNHIVIFNKLGYAMNTLKSDETRSIESMARGPDGLYLVDRLSRQVVVMGLDGRDRYTLGGDILKDPQAIAVDRHNRVFVSDGFDNTIRVFEGGRLGASFGGRGATPGKFNRITMLSIDQNTLYVADSLNSRIQTFHIAPPGARGKVHE